jgi:hypothetical protein
MGACPSSFKQMTNDTDLANHALGLIGEAAISAITDQASKEARTCRLFAEESRREVLRMGRWNCATKRETLVELAEPPLGDYAHQYQLPSGFLRLMEVNGEAVKSADEYFEIEGIHLLSNSDKVWIRYIADIPIGACDVLLQAAIGARLASKIAIPLSARLEQASTLEGLFLRRLKEAQGIDSKETQSAENPAWDKVLGRSRLGRARGYRRDPNHLGG